MSSQQQQKTAARLGNKQVVLLVCAGVASFLAPLLVQGFWRQSDADLVMPATRARPAAAAETAAPMAGLSAVDSEQASTLRMNRMVVRDPFAPLAPEVVAAPLPPPVAAPVSDALKSKRKIASAAPKGPAPPPAAPVAPPLPFTAVGVIQGKRIGDGQPQTFVQQGENLTLIRQGQTINNVYRVDEINAERVLFTYLPLGQKQTLPLLDTPK